MAWSSVITGGVHTKLAAGTTFAIGLDNSAMAGQVMVQIIAKDNVQTTDGSTNEITSITDGQGNTWTKLAEYTGAGLVGSQGATVALFASVITTTIPSGANKMTATFAASINACASSKWIFSVNAASTITLNSGTAGAVNSSAQSMTLSGLSPQEYLFVRGIGMKEITTGITLTTGYSGFNAAAANGGTTVSSISVQGEFRILNATTDTSAPGNASCEQASVYVTIKEVLLDYFRAQAMTGVGR